MLFRTRSVFILLVAAIVLAFIASPSHQGRAEPMTAQSIEDNRQACMTACSRRTGDASHCVAYCDCGTKGIAERMTEEEYQAGKLAIANNKRPADESIQKVLAIVESCAAKMQ